MVLIAFMITGWIIASLALSGDVLQATVPISIGSFATALTASSSDIILTVGILLFTLVIYWIIRQRKFLVEAVADLFARRKGANVAKPKSSVIGSVIGFIVFIAFLMVFRPAQLLNPPRVPEGGNNSSGASLIRTPGMDAQTFQSGFLAIYHSLAVCAFQIVILATTGLLMVIFLQGVVQLRAPAVPEEPFESAIAEETISILQDGARELREAGDYRRTILECYRRLCVIFDSRGDKAHHQLTARELQELMVRQFNWAEKPISQLTMLFEEARYSQHQISIDMKDRAIDAVNEIEDPLRHPSARTPEAIQ